MDVPLATYRIQFTPTFTFDDLNSVSSYFAHLGISHIYASPVFKAKRGSTHGYDVVDPCELNPQLGTPESLRNLSSSLRSLGVSWVQDIVPNHMAFDKENLMLMDVLEHGPRSKYFQVFDIEWNHSTESFRGRLLVPFLGKFYGEALENAEIQLRYNQNGVFVTYYELVLPLKTESVSEVLQNNIESLEKSMGSGDPDFIKFLGAIHLLKSIPSEEEPLAVYDQKKHTLKILWELYQGNARIHDFVDSNLRFYNGQKGVPESFDPLDQLLSAQAFRLSFWKVAGEEINYRRFFSINNLISVRVEKREVFDFTHKLIFSLIEEGIFQGLRVDHIDGLYDPTLYLNRLRGAAGDVYVVVEKILGHDESLPSYWPIQGSTGYDFLNQVNAVFCQKENEQEFDKIYQRFTGFSGDFEDLISDMKRMIIGKHMAGDVDNLAHFIKNISSNDRYGRDITLYGLRRALVEVMSHFPVYRTYVNHDTSRQEDRVYIGEAIERARAKSPGFLYEFDFIEKFLLLQYGETLDQEQKRQWEYFVMKFQQYTGPLMAKGFEDTLCYVYDRLISLNEVGGSPERFGMDLEEFHRRNRKKTENFPFSMNSTSTHDTKRGEDVRSRINVLSEIPREWASYLKTWERINRKKKRKVKQGLVPDDNDEYFLYQTLLGTFPFDLGPGYLERIKQYIIKAVREAKVHTAWIKHDIEYEETFTSFVEEILDPSLKKNRFLQKFIPFQKKIAFYGMLNSLSQTLLKLTCPGVPDFYQGTELWDLNLVDPDNRRPVDFSARIQTLEYFKKRMEEDVLSLMEELLSSMQDGRVKLFLIHRLLKARGDNPDLFRKGEYLPLGVEGQYSHNIIAFARRREDKWAITVAPRFLTRVVAEGKIPLAEAVWGDTKVILPQGAPSVWFNAVSGRETSCQDKIPVGASLKYFPVSLLVSK